MPCACSADRSQPRPITPEELDAGRRRTAGRRARSCTTSPTAKRRRRSGSGGCWRRTAPQISGLRPGRVRAPAALRAAARIVARAVPLCADGDRASCSSACSRPTGCAKARTARAAATRSRPGCDLRRARAPARAADPGGAGGRRNRQLTPIPELQLRSSRRWLRTQYIRYRSRVRRNASSSSAHDATSFADVAAAHRSSCAADPIRYRMSIGHLSCSYS